MNTSTIKYTAKFNGQTFIRRSKRSAEKPYTHCIIGRKSKNYYNPFNLSYDVEHIEYAISKEWKQYYPDNSTDKYLSVENSRYTALANTPIDEYLQDRLNERLCYFSTLDFDSYEAISWAGRPDLAAKQVETNRGTKYSDVRAIPVEL